MRGGEQSREDAHIHAAHPSPSRTTTGTVGHFIYSAAACLCVVISLSGAVAVAPGIIRHLLSLSLVRFLGRRVGDYANTLLHYTRPTWVWPPPLPLFLDCRLHGLLASWLSSGPISVATFTTTLQDCRWTKTPIVGNGEWRAKCRDKLGRVLSAASGLSEKVPGYSPRRVWVNPARAIVQTRQKAN